MSSRSNAGDPVMVPLINGGFALVDEEDWPRVEPYRWSKHRRDKIWYASAYIGYFNNKSVRAEMHRFLFCLEPSDRVKIDHVNHDGLDNRRSCNLRLASTFQNSVNSRKMATRNGRPTTSRYKGVRLNYRNKWEANIGKTVGGCRRIFLLGCFPVEEEAAFAYQVAAGLIHDPDFLNFVPIPEDAMPPEERQYTIRRDVTDRLKILLSGGKLKPNSISKYKGVRYGKDHGGWNSTLNLGNRKILYLGSFVSESECALAYDHAVSVLGIPRDVNGPIVEQLCGPDRSAQIRSEIDAKIDAFRRGLNPSKAFTSSEYYGACFYPGSESRRKPWHSAIKFKEPIISLGFYESDVYAAIAYNEAIAILGIGDRKRNVIPDEKMPDSERTEEIKNKVDGILSRWTRERRDA